jgi:hypothetical protein
MGIGWANVKRQDRKRAKKKKARTIPKR